MKKWIKRPHKDGYYWHLPLFTRMNGSKFYGRVTIVRIFKMDGRWRVDQYDYLLSNHKGLFLGPLEKPSIDGIVI